ncbi:acyl-CoA dehydrogenase [Aliikangiella sp. G2MR2-5]|uniref:acyl-CoA dehydrogenase n=1 Tax=Aliikangiella sp. G2MR2-5 TaxID=2788943 RepID=UPI0018AC2B35|nr:acyl-CoA dehydrogenase [Aliikangiella sp. G2MR2-5]
MSYKAPLDDMNFLLNQVFKVQESLGDIEAFQDFDTDLYGAILEEAAKFSENVLFPLNREGDEEGCHFDEGKVTTPNGFKEAYKEFCEAGWQGTNGDPEFGGQGLPKALHVLIEEMTYSANTSFCLYPSLTNGAYHAIHAHASDELKQTYLPPMLEGRWSGAMGLTEPHAGSDLGIIKSKAADNGDGTYKISGTKIFITGGDHDLSENIIHLVLAKLPGAPEGPKGISLFLVPKIKVNADGSLGESNGVSCGSIEHKMGIKASATCVMNFDEAEGYLVGKENRGLFAMFTMMNLERLSIGIQGIGLGETSYQLSKAYAEERKQGRNASGEATTIIAHADVRRMLIEQRAYTEAGRALAVFMGMQIDKQYHHSDESVRNQASGLMALLTPIAKAFFTDKGFDACNHGVQVLGGHGFIREWGLEQLVRDAKIAQIYEGTNGIQAQDLLVRKVCLDKLGLLELLYAQINEELAKATQSDLAANLNLRVQAALKAFDDTSLWLKESFANRGYEIQGGAVDYLHAAGLLVYGWLWLKMVNVMDCEKDSPLKQRKLLAANYFLKQQFSGLENHLSKVKSGYEELMAVDSDLI